MSQGKISLYGLTGLTRRKKHVQFESRVFNNIS